MSLLLPVLGIIGHLAAGIALGLLYFGGVWHTVRRFVAGARPATTILLMLGRFALLGGVLTLASLEGALPLLALAGGLLIARPLAMRRLQGAAP